MRKHERKGQLKENRYVSYALVYILVSKFRIISIQNLSFRKRDTEERKKQKLLIIFFGIKNIYFLFYLLSFCLQVFKKFLKI